jgi:hypothetical protein
MADDYDRRRAEREAEQLRGHEADPLHVPREIPVDDDEFGTEAYTAAWEDHPEDYWSPDIGSAG